MSAGRAVRIPVRPAATAVVPRPERLADPDHPDGVPERGFARNRSATTRAYRSFLIYLGATVVVYATLLSALLASPLPGVRNDPVDYGVFTALGLGIVGAAFALTVLPAPRGVLVQSEGLTITERSGKVRRLPLDPDALRPAVLRRYRAGPLNGEPVVLLEVGLLDGTRRAYLVDEGLIPTGRRFP